MIIKWKRIFKGVHFRPKVLIEGFYPDYHPEQKAAIQKTNKSLLICKLINAFEVQTGS